MLTASRRIDKCHTLGQRFSDKLPTTGTDKMTNARGGLACLELTEPLVLRCGS